MLRTIVMLPILISAATNEPLKQEVRSVFTIKNQRNVQLIVPFVHQVDNLGNDYSKTIGITACGPASLTMSFRHLRKDISLGSVIKKLPNSVYVKGVGFYKLEDGPKEFGFDSVIIENSPKSIYETLSKGNPIIMNIQNYDGLNGHAVVITGIRGFNGESAEALIAHDPFKGPYRRFEYVDNNTLRQPEGFHNPIGTKAPFYVIDPII